MNDDKYSYCPNCGRKGVYWKRMRNGEDNFRCRYSDCTFYFYTCSYSKLDRAEEARWVAAQPSSGGTIL